MPFYEYECAHCGHHEEALQKVTDKPLKKCPNCGKNALRKLMSAPVFRLKGSGWYETDFKSDKENKRNLAGADKEEAKSETKADAKTDAKAEAKSETKSEPKSDTKSDAPKAEPAKPAAEKASKSAAKSTASVRPKAKPTRPAKRPTRR
jgi:putative FmdB family regulatory protein